MSNYEMNKLEVGQEIETTVVAISGDSVFLDLNSKSEGVLDTAELLDKDGKITISENDKIKVFFLGYINGEMRFTTKIAGDKADKSMLENAYQNGIPVEGKVEKEIKGGFEVKIGDDPSDPVFCITDLLPHLAEEQMKRSAKEIIRGEEHFIEPIDISRNSINKAFRQLRKSEYQDKLLSIIAVDYRERFMKSDSMFDKNVNFAENVSIYTFFDTPVTASIKKTGGIKISILPNDLLRPAFALIRQKENLLAITQAIAPERKEFTYYELQEKLRMIQAEDRRKRLEILSDILWLEHLVTLPSGLVYSNNEDYDLRQKENRDIEYPYYAKSFRTLTREQFDILADTRNAVYHNGIALDIKEALEILKNLRSSAVRRKY